MNLRREIFSLGLIALVGLGAQYLYKYEKAKDNREMIASSQRNQAFVERLGAEVLAECHGKPECFSNAAERVVATSMAEDGFTASDRANVRSAVLGYVHIMGGAGGE